MQGNAGNAGTEMQRNAGRNAGTDGTFPIFQGLNWGQSRLSPVYPPVYPLVVISAKPKGGPTGPTYAALL